MNSHFKISRFSRTRRAAHFAALLGAITTFGSAAAWSADNPNPGAASSHARADAPMQGKLHNRVNQLVRVLSRSQETLGITDAQIESIHMVVDAARSEFRALARERRDLRNDVSGDRELGEYDPAIVAEFAESMGDITAERIKLSASVRNEILSLLTQDQLEQLEAMRDRRRENRRERRG